MPVLTGSLAAMNLEEIGFQTPAWDDRLSVRDAPDLAPAYPQFRSFWPGVAEQTADAGGARAGLILGGASPSDPQYFQPPTSGFAANGLPIYSWDQAAIQITRDSSGWAGLGVATTVTYGFRSSAPAVMPNGTGGFLQFTAEQIALTEEILALWSEVANITFQRVDDGDGYTNSASMLFANYSTGAEGASAFAYYPGSRAATASAGDVWINFSLTGNNSNLVNGAFGPHTLSHEIGHAIGLAHPGDYDASDGTPPTYPGSSVYWQDGRMFTVMSYFGSAALGGNLNAFAAGPQLHDIAAAQRLYGVNMSTRASDTTYGFNSNTGHAHFTITADGDSPVFAIWDAGGNDTLDFSGYSTQVEIDLRAEAFSSAGPGNGGSGVAIGNIAIARGVVIENGIGGSNADLLIGNSVANVLTGNSGNDDIRGDAGADTLDGGGGDDILDGGSGADALNGGNGNDVYHVDDAGDVIIEIDGSDQVYSSVSFTLSNDLEHVQLTGDAISATGNDSGNTLGGNAQDNVLNGMGGADSMWGEGGNDTIVVDHANDFAVGGAGYDIVEAHASWSVNGGQIEEIRLMGSAQDAGGSTSDGERIVGNALANTLNGYQGDDVLFGHEGADTLIGEAGGDTLTGGGDGDAVNGGDGDDTIHYTFGDGIDVTDGGAGTDTLVILGTFHGQTLDVIWNGTAFTSFKGGTLTSIENVSANLGLGTDTLRYVGSSAAISVNLALGTATGFTSIAGVEFVYGANFDDTIIGDGFDNRLEGEGGADAITGAGGADVITAGLGNDTVDAGSGNDIIRYAFGDGTDATDGGDGTDVLAIFGSSAGQTLDMVWNGTAFTSYRGGTLANVEQVRANMAEGTDTLTYVGSTSAVTVNIALSSATGFTDVLNIENATGAEFNDSLTGNASANVLIGNGGDDVLVGFAGADTLIGGAGADAMTGGNDADVFVFQPGSGADTINAFDANPLDGQDILRISGYGVTAATFSSRVTIADLGSDTLVTIDGVSTILLVGVNGNGDNVIDQSDFLLAG